MLSASVSFRRFSFDGSKERLTKVKITSAHDTVKVVECFEKCELKVCLDESSAGWKMDAVESVFVQELLDRTKQHFIRPTFHVSEQTEQDGPMFVFALCKDEEHLLQSTARFECPINVKRAHLNKPPQVVSPAKDHHLPRINCFEQYRAEEWIRAINRLYRCRILWSWHVSVDELSPCRVCPPESRFQSLAVYVLYWFVKAVGTLQIFFERCFPPYRLDLVPARKVGVTPRLRSPQTDAAIALAFDPHVTPLCRASVRFVSLPDIQEVVDDHVDPASAGRKCL